MDPVRIGIIGCGDVANFGHAPAINAIPETQLVSVFDPAPGRAEDFARRHSVPNWFTDLDQFLNSGLEAVTICSPAGAHRANLEACVKAKLAVLCEKPIAGNVADGEAMVRLVQESKIPFMVGFVYRYSPVAQQIKAWVDAGVVGKIKSVRLIYIWQLHGRYADQGNGVWIENPVWVGRMREGGPMIDCGVHLIDLARWWLGSDIEAISGHGAWVADYEAPDHVYCHLDHADGCHTMIETSFSYGHTAHEPGPIFTYDLIGDGGFIRYDRNGWRLEAHTGAAVLHGPSASEKGFWEMYRDWANALRSGNTTHLPTGLDALIASEIATNSTEQAKQTRVPGTN